MGGTRGGSLVGRGSRGGGVNSDDDTIPIARERGGAL